MKRILFSLLLAFSAFFANAADITISTQFITTQTWTANNRYILTAGFHYVASGNTLTIKAGTVVMSNGGNLIITRGAKIIANGTATSPIVFTSSKPAGQRAPQDWGGIVILGKAPINEPGGVKLAEGGLDSQLGLYGGTAPLDNSGSLKYCRIEFAGVPFQPNNETNGLTLCGVGSKTVISYVQVSYGGDDSFEWFGGTVNGNHLIAYKGLDDDFDTDLGWSGHVQYALGVRDSSIADISGSNGFESDNDATGTTNAPFTSAQFSNVTLLGPIHYAGGAYNANYKRGAHLRRNTKQDIYNSLIVGWPTGLFVDGTSSGSAIGSFITGGELNVENNFFAGNEVLVTGVAEATPTWLTNGANTTLTNPTDVALVNPYATTANPDFRLTSTSPAISGASFSELVTGNTTGFAAVAYRGAFNKGAYGAGDWSDCWASFDPQNEDYSTGNFNYTMPTISISPATTITLGNSFTANASNGGSYTVEWYKSTSTFVPVAVGTTGTPFTPGVKGTYYARLVSDRGCATAKTGALKVVAAFTDGGEQSSLTSSNVTVFPNPTTGAFTVNMEIPEGINTAKVTLLDMTGRVLSTQTVEVTEGLNQVKMNVENQTGIFILQIQANEQITTHKVVIN